VGEDPGALRTGRLAAQYLRMSTEHQRYSIANQVASIEQFAKARGYSVIATYADKGISGVDIKRRDGLKTLLADILGGDCGFDTVLVYDVSRWGRFQNPDQSAHYEFICAEVGVQVEYCAEIFDNDGSLSATLLKSLKRVMAAEYSRELSIKTAFAKTAMLHRGFWQGGSAGYGLRRQMVKADGTPGPIMELGEYKAIQGCRTILVPGPQHEIAVVQRIYRMFVEAKLSRPKIARVLNAEGIGSEFGRPWTGPLVNGVLTNPKYLGDLVGNRTVNLLDTPRRRREESEWVRKPRAFEPIVSRKLFDAAQARAMERRVVSMSRAEMLDALGRIYERHGRITGALIDADPWLPCSGKFYRTFGGSPGLYRAIGAPLPRKPSRKRVRLSTAETLKRLRRLYERCGYLSAELINTDPTLPGSATIGRQFGQLHHAYFRVGFVPFSPSAFNSAVGRARVAAARAIAEQIFNPAQD
jgi:DNA invertase Pin-like site-specific DNA recombinase